LSSSYSDLNLKLGEQLSNDEEEISDESLFGENIILNFT
jgi:hypothetical protein